MLSFTVKRSAKCFFQQKNCLSSFNVIYENYGDPRKVLVGREREIQPLKDGQVLLKFLASSVNPADINQIQGVYPIKPSMPAVGGNEGVATVIETKSQNLKVGDWVIPALAGSGTWRSHAVFNEKDAIKIDNSLPLESAATLSVNPCTAYRMLMDFERIDEGDVVLQNGANSAVGQAVIQIATDLRIKTVNVIRDRPRVENLKRFLFDMGADYVLTEEECKTQLSDILRKESAPKLALNCVGGMSATNFLKYIRPKGTMVTYGCMSKIPFKASAASLIFADITFKGFWMSRWNDENNQSAERYRTLDYLSSLIKKNKLKCPPVSKVPLEKFPEAIENAMTEFTTHKQLLV
ncbi:unnamed protein product [Dimorphilus gyrociliatus]|uniref:Enoyl-[acyl-carrier-protein] reductase, mitochondrial n=1 Tax=Dimorphilus gyrociliatus TaxID=2664684 RepID=A0A7I8VPR6_9ANNE|nr:unnamed protein product [Dimorphilus gyrociliatus]